MSSRSRVAIVTGAGSGIGKACALALLRDGYCVILAGRRLGPLTRVAEESGAGERALPFSVDVCRPESVKELFAVVNKQFGRLNLLFNNAGTNVPAVALEEIGFEQWRAVVDTNLTGPFLCTQEAFKLMKSQKPMGGRIINNGSISAYAPRPGSAPYTATKHGITGLTKSTSLDGRKYNIACSQIDIGNALTEMTARMGDGVPQADGSIRPEPLMDVKHVAEMVLQMANLPLEANVQFVTIMATQMPLVGRG